jgi:hypothetical protein
MQEEAELLRRAQEESRRLLMEKAQRSELERRMDEERAALAEFERLKK